MPQTHPLNQEISLSVIKTACSNCNLRELCLPFGLSLDELERLDDLVSTRRRIKRGDHLYRAGEAFDAIYAIRSGFFKTDVLLEDGRDQVTGFQMAGELLGMDGISTEIHTCNAIALEDSEICAIPLLPPGKSVARNPYATAPLPQGHEPGNRTRPRRHDAARHDACRRAAGRLPAQPVTAIYGARFLARRVLPAHDT
jgi:hypothetical protein